MLRFDTSFDEMQVEAPRSEVLVRTKSGNEQGNSACAWHEKYRRDNWGEKHQSAGVKKRRTQVRLIFFELGLIKRRGYNYSVHTMPERVATIESVITSYTWHRGTKVGDDIILHTTRVATS